MSWSSFLFSVSVFFTLPQVHRYLLLPAFSEQKVFCHVDAHSGCNVVPALLYAQLSRESPNPKSFPRSPVSLACLILSLCIPFFANHAVLPEEGTYAREKNVLESSVFSKCSSPMLHSVSECTAQDRECFFFGL